MNTRETVLKDIGAGQRCGGGYWACSDREDLLPDEREAAAATLGAYLRDLAQELRGRDDLSPNEADGVCEAADWLEKKANEA